MTLLFIILTGMENSTSDPIEILLTNSCHSPTTRWYLFYDLHVLKLDENRPDDTRVCLSKMLCPGTASVGSTIPLLELTNAKTRTEVHFPCDGSGADVVPVLAIRGKFLEDTGFDDISPNGKFEFI